MPYTRLALVAFTIACTAAAVLLAAGSQRTPTAYARAVPPAPTAPPPVVSSEPTAEPPVQSVEPITETPVESVEPIVRTGVRDASDGGDGVSTAKVPRAPSSELSCSRGGCAGAPKERTAAPLGVV